MYRILALAVASAAIPCALAQSLNYAAGFNLTRPIGAFNYPGDTSRVYFIEKNSGVTGRIRLLKNGVLQSQPFLSVAPVSQGSEQGLLGLAFHPNYAQNGYYYINFTDAGGDTIIRRHRSTFNAVTQNYLSDVNSGETPLQIIRIPQPFSNHNGGAIHFGEDGFLHVFMGDGGDSNDPGNRSQNRQELLGKVLRLDIDRDDFPADNTRFYGIPADNPFVGNANARPEILSLGLRNPWKASPDRRDQGGLGGWLIPDVGQNQREELNYQEPPSGLLFDDVVNFGWKVYEGTRLAFPGAGTGPFTFPIHEYDHSQGCSISGGAIYRGVRLGPDYWGHAFFSDFCEGFLDVLPLEFSLESGEVNPGTVRRITVPFITQTYGIDSDATGELWIGHASTQAIRRIINDIEYPAVEGTVTLQDCPPAKWPRGITLRYLNPTTGVLVKELQVGLPPSGRFRVPAYVGTYRLQIQATTWISSSVPINTAGPTDVSGLAFSLVNGDVNGDNEISPGDFSEMGRAFGTFDGEPNYLSRADLNRDGEVGPADFAILANGFGLFGS